MRIPRLTLAYAVSALALSACGTTQQHELSLKVDPKQQAKFLADKPSKLKPHHCSRNRLERDVISSCARKRGLEFRRCLWRSAVGFLGIRDARPEGSNELGGQRVPGCVVRG